MTSRQSGSPIGGEGNSQTTHGSIVVDIAQYHIISYQLFIAGIFLIEPLGTKFNEILMHLKMPSAKWRPFCLVNVLKDVFQRQTISPQYRKAGNIKWSNLILYHQTSNISHTISKILKCFVSSCRYLCPIHWSQVLLSQELSCSCSSAGRGCFNYIWVINNFIAY